MSRAGVGFRPWLAALVVAGGVDTDTSANHGAFNQNQGMWRAYGLLYRLLDNGIPVRWIILGGKTATTESTSPRRPSGTCGPGQAVTNVTLRSPPRIANEAINASISMSYLNVAGIPDLNGRAWSSASLNVLTQAQIAGGGLFTQRTGCAERRFDVFVTPHNGGYSYLLSDPANLGTRTYAALDTFVQQGGGWTALCHSILSNENALADLTRNGAAAVRKLFLSNTGGTWSVHPAAAGLPVAQGVRPRRRRVCPAGRSS